MCKPPKIKKNDKTGRTPEFSLMSKGLGSCYLRTSMVDWHKIETASRVYVPLDDNKKACMPRYYKDKIYNSEDKIKIGKQRRTDLEHKAKRVRDVLSYQRNSDEMRRQAYTKMYSDSKKHKL